MKNVSLDALSLQARARECRQIAQEVKDDAIRDRLRLLASDCESRALQMMAEKRRPTTSDEL